MNFSNNRCGLQDMLEHCLNPNTVEYPIIEGELMGVSNQAGVRRCEDVSSEQLDGSILVELVCTQADRSAADDQDVGPVATLLEKCQELCAI